MKLIREISEKDYSDVVPFPENFPVRRRTAARAVVFDDNFQVALLHVTTENRFKIPGGGVEEGEDIPTTLVREVLEEAGCEITIIGEIGKIIERKAKFNFEQESYCYLAKVTGEKRKPEFTKKEIEKGFELIWVPLEKAKELFANAKVQEDEYSESQRIRDQTFFLEAKKEIEKRFA